MRPGNICNTAESCAGRGTARTAAAGPASHFPAGNAGVGSEASSTSVGLATDKVRLH